MSLNLMLIIVSLALIAWGVLCRYVTRDQLASLFENKVEYREAAPVPAPESIGGLVRNNIYVEKWVNGKRSGRVLMRDVPKNAKVNWSESFANLPDLPVRTLTAKQNNHGLCRVEYEYPHEDLDKG